MRTRKIIQFAETIPDTAGFRMSAIGTKRTYRVALHMSAFRGKRTCAVALQMSANDPKRTCRLQCEMSAYEMDVRWISLLSIRRESDEQRFETSR